MEDDLRIGISLSEGAWTLATPSTLLPLLASPVNLDDRGAVLYENLWDDQLIGGSVLHEISWDNSGNPQFEYDQKAGPYASADSPPGSTANSLVLDVEFSRRLHGFVDCRFDRLSGVTPEVRKGCPYGCAVSG